MLRCAVLISALFAVNCANIGWYSINGSSVNAVNTEFVLLLFMLVIDLYRIYCSYYCIHDICKTIDETLQLKCSFRVGNGNEVRMYSPQRKLDTNVLFRSSRGYGALSPLLPPPTVILHPSLSRYSQPGS